MRKLFVITLGMLVALPVFAKMEMPTFYGKVNREVRMLKVETKVAGAKEVQNIRSVGVGNSESRLGVKGEYNFGKHWAKYVLEMGINTSNVDDAGTFRIRRGEAELGGFWGSIVAGQTYVAGATLGLALDPLSGTIAGLQGVDVEQIATYKTEGAMDQYGIGFVYRGRQDLVGYRSPLFHGAQFFTTIDNGDKDADETPDGGSTVWSNQLTWEKKMGEMDLGVYANYVVASGSGLKDASVMGAGLKFGMKGFVLTGMYTKTANTDESTANAKEKESTHMMVTGKYTFLKNNVVAVTYGKRENEDPNDTAGEEKDEINQLAFGYIRVLSQNVSVRAAYAMVEKKYEDGTENTAGGWEASIITVGTTVTF